MADTDDVEMAEGGAAAPEPAAAAAAPEEEALPPLSLDVLSAIKAAQMQNGLRHADYQRYRQYCTRRLRRVRKNKAVNLRYGRGRGFVKKVIEPGSATDVRHLFVPLMNAERAWSYAMQLKQETAEDGGESRRRFHLMRRLAKAHRWSEELRALCGARGDDRTALEGEAYAAWMGGNLHLEKENWEEALPAFVTASQIYGRLAQVGTPDQQELLRQRVEEIEPSVRYCKYNLELEAGALGGGDTDALIQMLATSKGPAQDLLQSKLDAVLAATRKQHATTRTAVRWLGARVVVRAEGVRMSLLEAEDARARKRSPNLPRTF